MDITNRISDANYSGRRYVIHQGGTGSGKTYTVLQYLLSLAISKAEGLVISVVSESLPHLKRGALRDFKRILQSFTNLDYKENKTECRFEFGSNTIEFFSADSEAKLRGARRDILFINECNNVDYESFQQLDVRTRRQTILDYNPVRRFWVHDMLLPTLPAEDHLFCKSTYLDNPFLLAEEKRNIERRRANANWWKVYGEGEIGIAEGVVFSNWTIVPATQLSIDNEQLTVNSQAGADNSQLSTVHCELLPGTLLGYGIDFGFTHSPTAIVQVNESEGGIYVRELLYRTGVQNDELLAFVKQHLDISALAVADSAEPKTIDYLYRKGWHGLKGAHKSKDSLLYGINLLLDRRIHVTADSLNLIKEMRQYMWDTNKDGALVHRPVKECDHAIDALRYLYSHPQKKKLVFA